MYIKLNNPYKDTSNSLIEKQIGNLDDFLNKNIKDKNILKTIKEIISLKEHNAFNIGVREGKREAGNSLREIIDFE